MNLYDYIARDQAKIISLINELLDINLHAVQQRFFDDIKSRLIMHIEAKTQVLYPSLGADTRLQDTRREDSQIIELLDDLTEEGMTSPKWLVMFGELKHAVEHQAAQAETGLFAVSRLILSSEEASSIPGRMDRVKKEVAESRNLSVRNVADS